MIVVAKGSKTDLIESEYTVDIRTPARKLVDLTAVLLDQDGRVRDDDDFVFYNNPVRPGVRLTADGSVEVDLSGLDSAIDRVLVVGSTEAQGEQFGSVEDLTVDVRCAAQQIGFEPPELGEETVLQMVAFYRRGQRWKLDAIGQGYRQGLAAFAEEVGITVGDGPEGDGPEGDDPKDAGPEGDGPESAATAPTSASSLDVKAPAAAAPPVDVVAPPAVAPPAAPPINLTKVETILTKDSAEKTAQIDLRKSGGDPGWLLTVGLEWDGRDAVYGPDGDVLEYGTGDLDVYFYCRDPRTNEFVVISGEPGHHGTLDAWPFVLHGGDTRGPGRGRAAVEQVAVRPTGDCGILVNVYQSVDNGAGAIDTFGQPRVVVRYGQPNRKGELGTDADTVVVYVGNGKNSFWATVAHIEVQGGSLMVNGETRYSRLFSERMPGLSDKGIWTRAPKNGPKGRSKKRSGLGLDRYEGSCR